VIANSERTRRELINHIGLRAERIHTIYLGSEMRNEATHEERATARERLGLAGRHPLLVFVGALGHDHNKGFDTLWRAWKLLCARSDWNAHLLVAGGGRGVARWRELIDKDGMSGRVKLLGFTERMTDVLAAGDLLVSPVRYEAYGLNVHEAICRGMPALVSGRAGITELFSASLAEMLLPDPEDANDLARRLIAWRENADTWRERFKPLAARLRSRTWRDMAAEMVAISKAGEGFAATEDHACATSVV
jgi:glycosyltransferase involved in cell wall biosynthesis